MDRIFDVENIIGSGFGDTITGGFDDRELMGTVYHRFALSNPALVSAPSKKSFSG